MVTSLLGIIGLGQGVMFVGFAPANMFWMALVGMSLMGFMNPMTNGPLQAVLQSTVKPEMQGRVTSLINSAATAIAPISLALAGPLSDLFGIRVWFIFGGLASLFIGVIAFFIPANMNMEDH